MSRIASCAAALGIVACGGGSSGPPASLYGGTYDTTANLVSNNCSPAPNVQTGVQTVVSQTGSSPSISLSHAGATYPATVDGGGSFTVPRTPTTNGFIGITGQFSSAGFNANVHVEQTSPACDYTVAWTATKLNPMNDPYYTGTH